MNPKLILSIILISMALSASAESKKLRQEIEVFGAYSQTFNKYGEYNHLRQANIGMSYDINVYKAVWVSPELTFGYNWQKRSDLEQLNNLSMSVRCLADCRFPGTIMTFSTGPTADFILRQQYCFEEFYDYVPYPGYTPTDDPS